MRRQRVLIGALGALGLGGLAYIFSNQVRDYLLLPLAYDFWLLQQIYQAIPQAFIWIVILLLLIYLPISILYGISVRPAQEEQMAAPRGPVETLSSAISQCQRGIYFKWRLANLLSNVAVYILKYQDRRLPGRKLSGRDWNPPAQVEAFLDAGLNSTFADYPTPGPFQPPRVTPLDLDLESVVTFLESELDMEQPDKK